jgi:hypothetical protein
MMKKVLFSALATLALASTSAAFAATSEEPAMQARAADDYRLSAGEFEAYRHVYDLKTGDKVYFTQQGKQRFFAQLDGQKRERMYAKSRGVFLTESGTRVEFSESGHAVTIDKLP